jgi:16S rRNA (adenine1518-N6/adenine1519-N6)-dimethyltransferase
MHHKPLKKFGQNFLTQPAIAEKIVSALQISGNDHIIEIGPGKGILSSSIIGKQPALFSAIEIDKNLARELTEKYEGKLKIIEQDFLNIDLSTITTPTLPVKVIGNIPYNITSPILFKLVDFYKRIDCSVLMIQKEVARRIVASPGTKDYGILAVLLQTYCTAEYLFDVSNKNFSPVPKVDSAVIKLHFFDEISGINNLDLFKIVVRGSFNYRRKMIRNSLIRIFNQSIVTSLDEFDLTKRPEQLSIDDFKKLANTINNII